MFRFAVDRSVRALRNRKPEQRLDSVGASVAALSAATARTNAIISSPAMDVQGVALSRSFFERRPKPTRIGASLFNRRRPRALAVGCKPLRRLPDVGADPMLSCASGS